MTLVDLIDNIIIQGKVKIKQYNEEKDDMITLWETEDFEYENYNIPYGVAIRNIEYIYNMHEYLIIEMEG